MPNIHSLFHFQKNAQQEVSDSIEEVDGKGVSFILDGFEEYPSKNYEKSIIKALINKSFIQEAMVVVTSCPAAASDCLHNKSSFKQIELFQFSRKYIFEYIDCFPFSDSINKAELYPEPGVLGLCYLPVNVAIICFLYDYDPELLPETQTEMYEHFTASIIIRQLKQYNPSFKLQSLEDLKDEEEKLFKKLCSIAFEMTASSRQVMSHGEFTTNSQLSLWLITTDISPQLSGEYRNSYSFLHLKLQEFLAAYHISKSSQEMQKAMIEKYCDTVHMRNVWKFYFGLVKYENEILATMLTNKLIESPEENQLYTIECAYEAKKKCITELVSSSIIDTNGTVSTYDIAAVAYVMSEAASIHSATLLPVSLPDKPTSSTPLPVSLPTPVSLSDKTTSQYVPPANHMSTKKHTSFSILYIGAILALMLALVIAIFGLQILTNITFYHDSETNSEHTIPRLSSKLKVGEMLFLKSIDAQSTIRIIQEVTRHCNDLSYHLHLDRSSV